MTMTNVMQGNCDSQNTVCEQLHCSVWKMGAWDILILTNWSIELTVEMKRGGG